FQYAYHYGDMYAPYIKQEEPLKAECQHFLDCIRDSKTPLSSGTQGLELVRILEASSVSLKQQGSPVDFVQVPPPSRVSANALQKGLLIPSLLGTNRPRPARQLQNVDL